MRIGILGAGSVGSALGRGWRKVGHEVTYGVREPGKSKVEDQEGNVATVAEAAAGAEVVVLAVPWGGAEDAVRAAGGLAGKIVLDCTNPLLPNLGGLALGHDTSAGEQVAAWAPGARVVKIFNTTGANNMANPVYGGRGVTMLYCGDDAGAKQVAAGLAADLGFQPQDAGPLTAARLLEPLALLWITLAYRQGLGREFAFELVRR